MHIHLDPLGGIAGDMFIAAITNAFPELKPRLERIISEADFPQIAIKYSAKNDGVLTGLGFKVTSLEGSGQTELDDISRSKHGHGDAHQHKHQPDHSQHLLENKHDHEHSHRSYAEIRRILEQAKLPEQVREHSLKIFQIIGEAESEVHGVEIGKIAFHEVGGWDSVIDVIGAACAIDYLGDATWSYTSLPIGGGFIETAHGKLPVPPPAVALILRGFIFHDDKVMGERVTPTGAAILKYLMPQIGLPAKPLELKNIGHGFGTRKLPGLSNILRVLSFEAVVSQTLKEFITVFNFEVDDMTGEELSVGLEKLRNTAGVLDVIQTPAFGKKNRVTMSIQVLAHPDSTEKVAKEILSLTTTLGVRHHTVSRTILSREIVAVQMGQRTARVKVAQRPGGTKTAKVDIDDVVSAVGNYDELRKLADAFENNTLKNNTLENNHLKDVNE